MKKLISLFLALALCLSLAACGAPQINIPEAKTSEAETEPPAVATTEAPTTEAPEPSTEATEPASDGSADYIGKWQYTNQDFGYAIYDDNTYEAWQTGSAPMYTAEWEMTILGVALLGEDGNGDNLLTLENGTMTDALGDELVKVDDFSFVGEGGDDSIIDSEESAYIGIWEYVLYTSGFVIEDGGVFSGWTADGLLGTGTWELESDGLHLYDDTGASVYVMTFTDDGNLVDNEGDELFSVEEFTFQNGVYESIAPFLGTWEFYNYNEGIIIYSDYSYEYWDESGLVGEATWELREDSIAIQSPDGTDELILSFNSENDLVASDGEKLAHVSSFTFAD